MEHSTWVLVNGPLFYFNSIVNAYFLYCMVRPLHGERIKQPLKLLLSSIVLSTAAYLMPTLVVFLPKHTAENSEITRVVRLISVGCLSTSVSSCVWLNFFYCTQIVPAQRALFIWIKKNIKSFIFCVLSFEIFCSVLDFAVVLIGLTPADDSGFNHTFTANHIYQYTQMTSARAAELKKLYVIMVVMQRFHFYFCAGVMLISSGVTVVYLARHMRRMIANGQSLSCSKLSSQVRVTAMGIFQGLLYLFFALWREYVFITDQISSPFIGPYIHLTSINLYMTGTTFSLGVGQAVFRQRAAQIWTRVAQLCKRPTVQQSE